MKVSREVLGEAGRIRGRAREARDCARERRVYTSAKKLGTEK